MEDIKVDIKLIIITICISFFIGTVIWGVYNIYLFFKKDENQGIENFEGDWSSSKIESMGSKESDLINDDYFIQPNVEKKFQINNDNFLEMSDEWGEGSISGEDSSAEYNFPPTFNELININLIATILDMSDWTEDGTYEDFIEDFVDVIRYKNILEDVEYKTRPINIGGNEFQIVMIETEKIIGSYFCLAKNGYAYCLQAFIPRNLYTDHWEQTIDKIFSTFRII